MTTPVRHGAWRVEGLQGPPRSYGIRRIQASSLSLDRAGAAAPPSAAEQLRTLARRVRRLGLAGRFDPEAAFIERDELAHGLHRLAAELEKVDQRPPLSARPARPRTVESRRLAAVLAAKTSEIASLQALLAQAVRPGRRRRRAASEAQLILPLSEAASESEDFLEHAAGIVTRRRREYGAPVDLFERVAVRWSQVLGTKVTPAQVIVCLVDLKVAGLAHDPRHLDSITDIAGYAGCLTEVLSDA
jgi:hypothetical protein